MRRLTLAIVAGVLLATAMPSVAVNATPTASLPTLPWVFIDKIKAAWNRIVNPNPFVIE